MTAPVGCAVLPAELSGRILHRVTPGCRALGISHRTQALCIAKVFDPSGKAVAQRGQVSVFHPCLEAQHPFHLATLLPRAVSQRGFSMETQ